MSIYPSDAAGSKNSDGWHLHAPIHFMVCVTILQYVLDYIFIKAFPLCIGNNNYIPLYVRSCFTDVGFIIITK